MTAVTAFAAVLAAGWTAMPPPAPAVADGDVTVRVEGADLPATAGTRIGVVGCADVFAHSDSAARPMMGMNPRSDQNGDRSLAFAPTAGDAVGPLSYVDAVGATSVAQMSVRPRSGDAVGVAYAGYQPPADDGTSMMWIGRVAISAPAGGWSTLDAAGLTYTWTRYDLDTQSPVAVDPAPPPATVSSFVNDHGGDGYGFYALGMGCDGAEFNTDAWAIGRSGASTTYDFEGYETAVSIAAPAEPVAPGTEVVITGQVSDAHGAPLDGWAVLERKTSGGNWEQVGGAEATGPTLRATVTPQATTTYRWRVVDRARYSASESTAATVVVSSPAAPTDEPTPGASGAAQEPTSPGGSETAAATPAAPEPPAEDPSQQATPASVVESTDTTPEPTSAPPATPAATPAESPGATASDGAGAADSAAPTEPATTP